MSISDCVCHLSLFPVDEIACMFPDVSLCAEMSRCLWAPRLPAHHTGRDTESARTHCLLELEPGSVWLSGDCLHKHPWGRDMYGTVSSEGGTGLGA